MKIDTLYATILDRLRAMPEGSYVAELARGNRDRLIQKIGEEATEVVIAAKNPDKARLISEIADLTFHILVLMAVSGIRPRDVSGELERRSAGGDAPPMV